MHPEPTTLPATEFGTAPVSEEVQRLRRAVGGAVWQPGQDGYDAQRAGFQLADSHRPAVLVGATSTEDVQAAVAFAGAHQLGVAVQATGHGLSRAMEGGVLISTRAMTGIRVDPDTRTAWIQAGVRWQEVIDQAAPFGLAPLSGSFPKLGAVAYVLGGGLGLLARQYGYAADHVRSIEIVTADGRCRQVTADTDPELFWALRGAGANFGVVTGMEIELVELTRLAGGQLVFPGEQVAEVLRTYLAWTATVPETLSSSVTLLPYPDVPGVPKALRGRSVAQVQLAFDGPLAEAEELVAPLRAIGPRLADTLVELPTTQTGSIYREPDQPHAYQGTNAMLEDLDSSMLEQVVRLTGPEAPVMCVVQVRHLGGALARPPAVPNAVGHRDARYVLGVLSPLGGDDTATVTGIHRQVMETVRSRTLGVNPNFLYGDGMGVPVQAVYAPQDYRRLARLKALEDPANRFRGNRNIPPAAT